MNPKLELNLWTSTFLLAGLGVVTLIVVVQGGSGDTLGMLGILIGAVFLAAGGIIRALALTGRAGPM